MTTKKPRVKKVELPKTEQGLRLALQRVSKLPDTPRVTDLYYKMDVDGYGEEYLEVYVILDDRDADPVPSRAKLAPIEETIRDSLSKYIGYWVLFSIRSHSEQEREMKRRDAIVKPIRVQAA
jgi:hypothetical protein